MLDADASASLQNLRDGLRSARRPGELVNAAERAAMRQTLARVGLAVARDLGHDSHDADIGAANPVSAACPVERLAFLQSVAGRVLAAARRIGSEPPAALSFVERPVAMGRARHVGAGALRALVRTPNASKVHETVAVPTQDTPANRAAKTILAIFSRDAATIAALAQNAQLPAALATAERLRRAFGQTLRREPWRGLPLLPRVPPLTPTLRNAGAHVLLRDIYRRYRAGFAWGWTHPLFRLPERETWQVYEYFAFFVVVETLRGLGFRASEADAVRVSEAGVSLNLATGTASTIVLRRGATIACEKQTVRATYARRFDTAPDAHGYRSAAQSLVPDVVLESEGRLLILDAKFKTYTDPLGNYVSPLDDLRQLHSYRDAIRLGDTRPVWGAWAMYAGRTSPAGRVSGANRAVIAFPDSRPDAPFGSGEIGAILLRPNTEHGTLAALIEAFLRSCTSAPSMNARVR
ncbi:MAG: hypothetical protein H7Y38_03990 [Armatimonadetes bacterium]|nr:hypothetical protein [Armatimonadota bacterium]